MSFKKEISILSYSKKVTGVNFCKTACPQKHLALKRSFQIQKHSWKISSSLYLKPIKVFLGLAVDIYDIRYICIY